jgi:small multidrug resistance pump
MRRWSLLSLAIACEVTGSLSLKAALDHRIFYVLVAVGLGSSGVLLAVMLRRGFPLGLVYGIWSAAGVALTFVFSMLLYSEAVRPASAAGLVLIVLGVLMIELGSRHTAAEPRPTGGAS